MAAGVLLHAGLCQARASQAVTAQSLHQTDIQTNGKQEVNILISDTPCYIRQYSFGCLTNKGKLCVEAQGRSTMLPVGMRSPPISRMVGEQYSPREKTSAAEKRPPALC